LRFDEIYDATYRGALGFITSKCRCIADVNDIFQETYMELYRVLTLRGVAYIQHEAAFVRKLARQKLALHYSAAQRLRMFVSLQGKNDDGDEVPQDWEGDFLTADFSVNLVLLETARQYITEKPVSVQKIFYLTYEAGFTLAEVAAALDMNESNVKNKLYRTLKELRLLFEEESL